MTSADVASNSAMKEQNQSYVESGYKQGNFLGEDGQHLSRMVASRQLGFPRVAFRVMLEGSICREDFLHLEN
jgi:hypothetical protein